MNLHNLKKWLEAEHETLVTIADLKRELGITEPQPDAQPLNPIAEAYEKGEKIRKKIWKEGQWIKKHSKTTSIGEDGKVYTNFRIAFDFDDYPEDWELYTEPDAETQAKIETEMTDTEKIEYITKNKLTHKDCPSMTWYAKFINGYSPYIGGYRYRVYFYYGDKEMMWADYDNLDLSEWQPFETEQSPKFDQERFERIFCAVLVGDVYDNAIKATEDILAKLDAYYATKGGNNG